jgi:general secretion pathway protein G
MKMKRGFTLIEILIVIAVIAILLGITLPRFRGMQEEGSISQAKSELKTLQTALESYYIHNDNEYPDDLDDLEDAEPLIVPELPTDPFNPGEDYGYDVGGTNNQYYVIYSVGPEGDGEAEIDDDNEVDETENGDSCIYVSNAGQDTTP